jgi:hypothetical protein
MDTPDIKIAGNRARPQLAYKIDASLVSALGVFRKSAASDPSVLAERNLYAVGACSFPPTFVSSEHVPLRLGMLPPSGRRWQSAMTAIFQHT